VSSRRCRRRRRRRHRCRPALYVGPRAGGGDGSESRLGQVNWPRALWLQPLGLERRNWLAASAASQPANQPTTTTMEHFVSFKLMIGRVCV